MQWTEQTTATPVTVGWEPGGPARPEVRAFGRVADGWRFVLFVLQEDLPLFEFARRSATLVPVPETFRPPRKNIVWHQTRLPALAREHRLDVLHIPSYRRLLWPQPCTLVATIHDLAPFRMRKKYGWKRRWYARARKQSMP